MTDGPVVNPIGESAGRVVFSAPLTDGIGLYGGTNSMPAHHRSSAPPIRPIDGVIGVVSIGMSNGGLEWDTFVRAAYGAGDLNQSIVLGNCCLDSTSMVQWAQRRPESWKLASERARSYGLRPDQVQIAWFKMGSRSSELPALPLDRRVLLEFGWLMEVLAHAQTTFPNLRRVYCSSRSYAGYSNHPSQEEPRTGFDNGLAVRALVAESVGAKTPIWVAWGPYLWANGALPRSDGISWERRDFTGDGFHPSEIGRAKVAVLLTDFFRSDPTTKWMFRKPRSDSLELVRAVARRP